MRAPPSSISRVLKESRYIRAWRTLASRPPGRFMGSQPWLPAGHVFLEHADVPLVNEVANARTYLAIVSDAVRKMSKSDDHPLSVVFPGKSREQIGWLLRSQRNRGSQDRWVASDTNQISLQRGFREGLNHPATANSCPPGKSAMSCPALSEKIFLFSSDPNHF